MGTLFIQELEDLFMHLFYDLLNVSINAGWLVLAVLMLRVLLRKAPRWLHVALWGLVGIRLLLPISIESMFSLIPSAEMVPPTIMYEREPAIDSGISAVNDWVNPIIAESFAPDPAASANPLQIWGFIASAVWLIGLVLMLGYILFGYVRLRFRLRTATRREENVYESEYASSPFILGMIRPRIYLPYGLEEETLAHVIAHERAHLSRRDHLIKPLAFLLLAVYWFQPLLWVAYILLCRDIEYACDEKVIKNENEDVRRAYSMALLSCSMHRRAVVACPLAFGEVRVKERVKNVMHYKKPAFWLILLAAVAIVITAVCFLTNPKTNKKADTSPPMYYVAEKIVERDGVNYADPEHIPYFYIDANMTLYEKRKHYMTGSMNEEWKVCGVLEKVEQTQAHIEVWTLSCTDEFSKISTKTFTFYKNGKITYLYDDGNGGRCVCRMAAVPDMTKQLNVISIESLYDGIEVSHFGTNVDYRNDGRPDICLELWVSNDTEYILVHKGHEVYVNERGEHLIQVLDDVRLEKKTADGWQVMDYTETSGWRIGGGQTVRFRFDNDELERGVYRLTFFGGLALKSSDFSSEETVEYAAKDIPCAEVIFEFVNPGEHISLD